MVIQVKEPYSSDADLYVVLNYRSMEDLRVDHNRVEENICIV